MYQSNRGLRAIFRGAAAILAVCVLAFALFAVAAPRLVKHKTVRDALVKNLQEWSGGAVEIKGPIKLASLIALTVEVRDASVTPRDRLQPVKSIQAQSMKAIVSFPRLLLGRVEFKKVVISSAKIVLDRGLPSLDPRSDQFTLGPIMLPADFADKTPFSNVVIKRAKVIYAEARRKPYRTTFISQIKLYKNGDGYAQLEGQVHRGDERLQGFVRLYPRIADKIPLTLWFKANGAEIDFRGELDTSAPTLAGSLSLKSAAPSQDKTAFFAFHRSGMGDLKVSGRLNWTREKLDLDQASIKLGDYQARGSIALVLNQDRKKLEGTLASDVVDIGAWAASPNLYRDTLAFLQKAADPQFFPDLDVRLSAERVLAGPMTAGPIAMSLTSSQGRVSADFAEVGLFGGTASGRIDYDNRVLTVRTSGKRVDLDALSQALDMSLPVQGIANFRLNLENQVSRDRLVSLKSGVGQFSVTLSGANVLEPQILQNFNDVLNTFEVPPEKMRQLSNLPALTIEGDIEKSVAHAKVAGQDDQSRVSGLLHIDLSERSVSGQLSVSEADPEADRPFAPRLESSPNSRLTVSVLGTASKPSFGIGDRHDLSN